MKKGFTLVELSIVLVIIGLLIGGVLVGQSLVKSAEALKLLKEVQTFQIVYDRFLEVYKQRPGDFNNRVAMFGRPANGNNDGSIPWSSVEARYFWGDLYDAGLLDDKLSLYSGTPWYYRSYLGEGDQAQGQGPRFAAQSGLLYGTDAGITGSMVSVNLSSFGTQGGGSFDRVAVTGEQLYYIDKKIDDSLPREGVIRGGRGNIWDMPHGNSSTCSQLSGSVYVYKVDDSEYNCKGFFILEGG